MIKQAVVSFTRMKDGTREDYLMLHELEKPFLAGTADRLLRELASQGEETLSGYQPVCSYAQLCFRAVVSITVQILLSL